MNIVEKVIDLYYSLRFAVEDLYYKVKEKFASDEEYNYADYSNPIDEVVEEKPKKKKKKKTTKKKK